MVVFHQMVKGHVILKERELIQSCVVRLREVLDRPGFIRDVNVSSLKPSDFSVSEFTNADIIAEIKVGQGQYTIFGEVKANGQPVLARRAIEQLQYSMFRHAPSKGRQYGVFLAPFISEESARICREAGNGYVDLAGNAHLEFGTVYIDIRTAENPFKEQRENRPLFSTKGELVLRTLLTPPLKSWKVIELVKATGVSAGQVSTVRQRLLEREWAVVNDQGLRLRRPEELAQAWKAVYKQRLLSTRRGYTALHGVALETALRAAMSEADHGGQLVLGSFSAARWLAPFARQGTTYFYATAEGLSIAERHLELQSASRGENMVIWSPKEDDVFSQRVEPAEGIWCAGLVQTWLDLSASGERGSEAAEHLLQQELLPAWMAGIA